MNVAYIDNQNLYMATTCHRTNPWEVDMRKLRVYLREVADELSENVE